MHLYLAGPMTDIPYYNFPAFDQWAAYHRAQGHVVTSPAEMDREAGLEPHPEGDVSHLDIRPIVARDAKAITTVDALAVLPGWRTSKGTAREIVLAEWVGIPVLDVRTLEPIEETVLEEAQRLVYGDRNASYGSPFDDFSRTAHMWEAILGVEVTPEQVALCMVAVKISRECHKPGRDNAVDGAGYFGCLQRVKEERDRRDSLEFFDANPTTAAPETEDGDDEEVTVTGANGSLLDGLRYRHRDCPNDHTTLSPEVCDCEELCPCRVATGGACRNKHWTSGDRQDVDAWAEKNLGA